jgi:hypothetical protein
MIEVYRIPISKKQLATLPKEERGLLLLMGHSLNQISVFLKLFTFSSNKDPEHPIEERISAAQISHHTPSPVWCVIRGVESNL